MPQRTLSRTGTWGWGVALGVVLLPAAAQEAALEEVDPGLPGNVTRPVVEPQGAAPRPAAANRTISTGRNDLDPAVLGPPPGQPAAPLRREGDFVIDRTGEVVVTNTGWAVMRFIGDAKNPDAVALPPMVLQPCQRLESMLSAVEQQDDQVRFTLTGQVHVYRGVNYLLPTDLSGYSTAEPEPEPEAGAESQQPEDEAIDPTELDASPDADPSDLMGELSAALERPRTGRAPSVTLTNPTPTESAFPPSASSPAGGAVDPDTPLRREGEFLLQRAGRLIRSSDAQSLQFVFEADGSDQAEAPVLLLPCRLVERMETITRQRGDAQVFVISGRVYTFRGDNYLLPTVMKLQIDDGNLGG